MTAKYTSVVNCSEMRNPVRFEDPTNAVNYLLGHFRKTLSRFGVACPGEHRIQKVYKTNA